MQKEKKEKNLKKIKEFAKGNMTPIENFSLKFYQNGNILSLERIDEENKGEGVLRTLEPDGAIRIYNIKIHMPSNSNIFEIIRK